MEPESFLGGNPAPALRLVIRNRIQDLSASLDRVEALLEAWSVNPADTAQVMVILDEIASNIIRSAWPAEDEHQFSVDLAIQSTAPSSLRLTMLVVDDGMPFDPTAGPPPNLELSLEEREPGGLGRFMVKAMSESVEYNRVDGHNRLSVTKKLRCVEYPA